MPDGLLVKRERVAGDRELTAELLWSARTARSAGAASRNG